MKRLNTRKKSRSALNFLIAAAMSGCLLLAPLAMAEITTSNTESSSQRSLPVFPIQSFSTGTAGDVWLIRTSNSIEYCRSEAGTKSEGKDNKRSKHTAVIRCYPQEKPDGLRFASVQAVHNADPEVISAYAMTISGDLVYCRADDSDAFETR